MCFKVVFEKTLIGRYPAFTHLLEENFPQGDVSAFNFPLMPVLSSESPHRAVMAQWGLIPYWVRDFEQAKKIRAGTVNARSESVHEKPSFKSSWPGKRCILPVAGFFEPHEVKDESGGTTRESWKIELCHGGLFYLGGIYAQTNEHLLTGESLERDLFGDRPVQKSFYEKTFSLLTLEATGLLARVHNGKLRMPVIMSEEKALEWINPGENRSFSLLDSHWLMDQAKLRASCV